MTSERFIPFTSTTGGNDVGYHGLELGDGTTNKEEVVFQTEAGYLDKFNQPGTLQVNCSFDEAGKGRSFNGTGTSGGGAGQTVLEDVDILQTGTGGGAGGVGNGDLTGWLVTKTSGTGSGESMHVISHNTSAGTVSFNTPGFDATTNGATFTMTNPITRRENHLVSANIRKIIDADKGIVQIDDPTIFEVYEGSEFIIYKYGELFCRSDANPSGGSNVENNRYQRTSLVVESVVGDIVTFTTSIREDDSNTTDDLVTETNLPFLYISPYKFWILISCEESVGITRYYERVTAMGGVQLSGATYSEKRFSDSRRPLSPWNISFQSPSTSEIELTKDYGFGPLDVTTKTGGFVSKAEPSELSWLTFDLGAFLDEEDLDQNDPFTLLVENTDSTGQIWLSSGEHDTKEPRSRAQFRDPLPSNPILTVSPDKETGFLPEFKWSAQDSDLWYGILLLSNNNTAGVSNVVANTLDNQYSGSVFHIPLDEHFSTKVENGELTIKLLDSALVKGWRYDQGNSVYKTPTASDGGAIVQPITPTDLGLTGAGVHFGTKGSTYTNSLGGVLQFGHDSYTAPTTAAAIVTHFTSDKVNIGNATTIMAQMRTFEIAKTANEQVQVKLWWDNTDDAKCATLTSTTRVVNDGETPTCVILTFDKHLSTGNVKLFINGVLEDSTGRRKTAGSTNHWQAASNWSAASGSYDLFIGAQAAARTQAHFGVIEEIVIYNDVIYPIDPQNNSFILTKPLNELTGATTNLSALSYSARLFMKDYHNIRGKSTSEVAASSQVSWRKSAVKIAGG